jgi:hypothetical protein
LGTILAFVLELVPRIPSLIEAGADAVKLFNGVQEIIQEHRSPDEPEWDALEAQIAEMQNAPGGLRDTSRDV